MRSARSAAADTHASDIGTVQCQETLMYSTCSCCCSAVRELCRFAYQRIRGSAVQRLCSCCHATHYMQGDW